MIGLMIGLFLSVLVLMAAKLIALVGLALISVMSLVIARQYAFSKMGVALITVCNVFMWGFATNVMESTLMSESVKELNTIFHALQGLILR